MSCAIDYNFRCSLLIRTGIGKNIIINDLHEYLALQTWRHKCYPTPLKTHQNKSINTEGGMTRFICRRCNMEFTSDDHIMRLSQHIIDKHHGKMYLPYEMIKNHFIVED